MPNNPRGSRRLDAIIAAKARVPSSPRPGISHQSCGAVLNAPGGEKLRISQIASGASTAISRMKPDKASSRIQRRSMKYGG
ncbi:hypothetical protein D3C78_1547000 [compost metagenome]